MSRAVRIQGIECPIIREGNNIVDIVVDSVLKETELTQANKILRDMMVYNNMEIYDIQDKSVIGITESVVARAAGEYITCDDICNDIIKKFGKHSTVCLINPIYSRNRFSLILKGVARACDKLILSLPSFDEVGNPRGVNPFTGVNIEEYYKEICESENCECEIEYCERISVVEDNTIYCGLHDYDKWNNNIGQYCNRHFTLVDICSDKSPDWGVLGTNKATEEKLKLFPSRVECQRVCEAVKEKIKEKTGKDVIVCVYGDGCFKDPVCGIWEMADPVSMPGYTDKELIESTPNEFKLKYFIDCGISEKKIKEQINDEVMKHTSNLGAMSAQGTTPRVYRDLLASLMDLTSGSGDRATPVVLVQNYF